jgi:hypothetical protein
MTAEVVSGTLNADPTCAALVEAFNLSIERLNDRLFTHLDYAVIGTKV